MSIVRAVLRGLRLPLRTPLRTASGPIEVRKGFLLELEDESGRTGFGEALPLPQFGGEGRAGCEGALRRALRSLVGERAPAGALPEAAERALAAAPVARNACEIALLDLEAQRRSLPLAAWLAGAATPPAESSTRPL